MNKQLDNYRVEDADGAVIEWETWQRTDGTCYKVKDGIFHCDVDQRYVINGYPAERVVKNSTEHRDFTGCTWTSMTGESWFGDLGGDLGGGNATKVPYGWRRVSGLTYHTDYSKLIDWAEVELRLSNFEKQKSYLVDPDQWFIVEERPDSPQDKAIQRLMGYGRQ